MSVHQNGLLVDGLQSYGTKKAREPLGRARAADFERLAGVFASRVATAAPPPLTTVPDQTGKNQIALGIISRPSSFTYIAPESNQYYRSDFETSIVIDSFEIRIEEVDEPTTIE